MMFLNFLLWKRESVKVIRMNFLKSYVYLHCSSSIALNTMYGIPSILFDFVHNGMCTKKSIEAMRQLIANYHLHSVHWLSEASYILLLHWLRTYGVCFIPKRGCQQEILTNVSATV